MLTKIYFDIPVVTLNGWDPNTGQNTWSHLDVTPTATMQQWSYLVQVIHLI